MRQPISDTIPQTLHKHTPIEFEWTDTRMAFVAPVQDEQRPMIVAPVQEPHIPVFENDEIIDFEDVEEIGTTITIDVDKMLVTVFRSGEILLLITFQLVGLCIKCVFELLKLVSELLMAANRPQPKRPHGRKPRVKVENNIHVYGDADVDVVTNIHVNN